VKDKHAIWIALSELYLDTELDEQDIQRIAKVFRLSNYKLDQIKEINRLEVFPVLQSNLEDVAGAWAGFNEKWLIEAIETHIANKSVYPSLTEDLWWLARKWMQKDYWVRLEAEYDALV
jgi:hypothetical protein